MSNAAKPTPKLLRFEAFTIDPQLGELRKNGTRVRLQEQPFRVLAFLLEHAGQLVTRDELRQQLWPDNTFVDFDHGLNAAINRLRERLNDNAESPRYIETIPRRGYRFIAAVEIQEEPAPATSTGTTRPAPGIHEKSLSWRWGLAGSLILFVVAVLLLLRPFSRQADVNSSTAQPIHSLAVLPLTNLSSDPSQEYFADGMTDELISDLAQISALRVISRTSVMKYKNTRASVREIGKELNVDAVIEGSVERSGGRVRISAQLIRARTDTHLWAKSYERNLDDVLALQDTIAAAIAREVQIQLLPAEKVRLATVRAVKPDAYEAYLHGLYHIYKRDELDLEKSTDYFQRAVDLDPEYALAYTGLADSYALRGSLLYMSLPPREAMPKSKSAALQALRLDSSLGEGYATLAYVETLYDWDWARSEEDFKRALALKPNYAQAHLWYAMHLAARGRQPESIAEVKRAEELDPLSLIINCSHGLMLYFGEKYDDAIIQFHNVLELDPDFFVAHWELGLAYEEKGMFAEARSEFQKARALAPRNSAILESLGEVEARAGHKTAAAKILRQLTLLSRKEFVSSYVFALLYTSMGAGDRALVCLEKAYDQRDNDLIFLNVDPALRPIRSDPRFRDLLQRIGLSPNMPPSALAGAASAKAG